MRSLRTVCAVALSAAVLIAAAVVVVQRNATPEPPRRTDAARFMNELMSGTVPVGGPFALPDANGKPRTLDEFRGKLVLLYFGFTYCPDVCPTDLLAISEALKSLGSEAQQVQPLFVTLDPTRDTPQVLRSYAASFHPAFIALTGSEAQVRAVATAYKVFFEKVQPKGASTYFIDHMALTFFLDRNGRYVAALPGGTPSERVVAFMREMLSRGD